MQQQPNEDRLYRIEQSIEAFVSTAAESFSRLALQQEAHELRMAEMQVKHEVRMTEMQVKHEAHLVEMQVKHEARTTEMHIKYGARLNDHEDALLDHEEEHRRLLRAQVLIADELRETSVAQRRTEQNLAEATEKLNGLIAVVDDFIRRQPKQ